MAASIKTLIGKLKSATLSSNDARDDFAHASRSDLFAKTDPETDGDECLHDCSSCTIQYPKKFSIDETADLYGHVNAWSRHLIVATGKTDWVRSVEDEKGSIMEAIHAHTSKITDGKLMLSASNIPVPENPTVPNSTSVILLPSFTVIDNVTPDNVPALITHIINPSPTNTTALPTPTPSPNAATPAPAPAPSTHSPHPLAPTTPPPPDDFAVRACPHSCLVLLCSQKTRDARCGQSAPLLKRELERHLRPLGLLRDVSDRRPGGVAVYFVSHVGGHKFSANVLVYRRAGMAGAGAGAGPANGEEKGRGLGAEASQCIWLARIRPEDCENLVRYTILQGKVVKPERQLRGGFDRCRELVSW